MDWRTAGNLCSAEAKFACVRLIGQPLLGGGSLRGLRGALDSQKQFVQGKELADIAVSAFGLGFLEKVFDKPHAGQHNYLNIRIARLDVGQEAHSVFIRQTDIEDDEIDTGFVNDLERLNRRCGGGNLITVSCQVERE